MEEIEDIGVNESIINPELWSYLAVNKAIEALASGDNFKTSFMKFTALINTAEAIAKGQGRITADEIDTALEEWKKSEYYQKLATLDARLLAESTFKLELLSKAIGMTGAINMPLKLGKRTLR